MVQANLLALGTDDPAALDQVYNIAYGERTTLNELFSYLRDELSKFDPEIARIEAKYAPVRAGDIPHSLAGIAKAKKLLGYIPRFGIKEGLSEAAEWYYRHLGQAEGVNA